MSTFTLVLQDATRTEEIPGVAQFTGQDASGSFGILASHERFMTALTTGLCRYRIADADWQYVAAAGGILYFRGNRLTLSTRHYLQGNDYTLISSALQQQLLKEESHLLRTRASLHRMEQEMLKRLWQFGGGTG